MARPYNSAGDVRCGRQADTSGSADERSSRMSVSKPVGYQMPRQLGGAMLGMTCPWSRSRTRRRRLGFQGHAEEHFLHTPHAEGSQGIHQGGDGRGASQRIEPLLTQSTTVECSVDQRDGRLGIVYFDHKLRVMFVSQRYQHCLLGIMHNPESPFALTPVGTYREQSGKAVCQPWETGH
jgi:hypothetical protein